MDVKKTKIAFIINSLAGGGAERVASILLNEYAVSHEVYLVFTDNVFVDYKIPVSVIIKKVSGNFRHNYFLNILLLPVYGYKFRRYLKKNDIHIVMSFMSRPNFITGFTRVFGFKGKIVISERLNMLEWFKPGTAMGSVGKFLYKWLYPKADYIVPNSKLTAYNLQHVWKVKGNYSVIYNPVELEKIEQVRDQRVVLPGNPDHFKCIMVGRFEYPKNQDTLIDMILLLKDQQIDLIFVGKGEEMQKATNKVTENHLENRIFFIDFDPQPFKYIFGADAFVFSSLWEGFPNVLIEALACGIPVISVDCASGPREILAPASDYKKMNKESVELCEFGILVPVKNASLFAEAVLRLKNDSLLQEKYRKLSSDRATDFERSKMIKEFSMLLFN